MIESLNTDGFRIVRGVLEQDVVADLVNVIDRADVTRSKRNEAVFGARNLLDVRE